MSCVLYYAMIRNNDSDIVIYIPCMDDSCVIQNNRLEIVGQESFW